jgi:hypothetical protein
MASEIIWVCGNSFHDIANPIRYIAKQVSVIKTGNPR